MVSGKLEKLIFEGYSKDKPILRYTPESMIELFTAPDQLETKTIRTYGIDSMVCTPVYDEVEAALNPPRCEMLEYVKAAIGEGYQPENEEAITNLSLIDALNDNDLNREFGKCWQWYDMGGGMHETFEKQVHFEEHKEAVIQAVGHKAIDCQKVKAAADSDAANAMAAAEAEEIKRKADKELRHKRETFEVATKHLIKWLNDNSNPHAIIVIDPTSATLHTGEIGYQTEEFLKD